MASSLPFIFGAEFELELRPRWNVQQRIGSPPNFASPSIHRRYSSAVLQSVANILQAGGFESSVHDLSIDEEVNYSKWNITLDASLSKQHVQDGFCEIFRSFPYFGSMN